MPSLNQEAYTKRYIMQARIEKLAIEKYRASGHGLNYMDVQKKYSVRKSRAQRSLKHLHGRKVLFTSRDLIHQGIHLLANKNPQQYFPACIKGEIIENLKKQKSVHNDLEFQHLSTSFLFRNPNSLETRQAQTFLDVLLLLPYTQIYIHKLQLKFSINKQFIGEAKVIRSHEEIIGRRYASYIISSNGTVQISIRSNNSPFKLETELDECIIFSFLGQVKDRLLYLLTDVRELVVPPIMEWILIQCDVNRDIEIDEKGQLTLPHIQLKYAGRVFREYVKIMHGKGHYRVEESVKFNKMLPEALNNIRQPFASLEKKIDNLTEMIDQLISWQIEISNKHRNDSCEISVKLSDDKGGVP